MDVQTILPHSFNEALVCVCDDEIKSPYWNWWMGLRRAWNAL